jgi:hypothetical protein
MFRKSTFRNALLLGQFMTQKQAVMKRKSFWNPLLLTQFFDSNTSCYENKL